jgi:hypothetical protein
MRAASTATTIAVHPLDDSKEGCPRPTALLTRFGRGGSVAVRGCPLRVLLAAATCFLAASAIAPAAQAACAGIFKFWRLWALPVPDVRQT